MLGQPEGEAVVEHVRIEKATIADAPQIHQLVNHFANLGDLLPRSLAEVYEHLRDFFVVRDGQEIAACAALHVLWADLAEVRSLAVRHEQQDQGLGALLVEACVEEAQRLGIETVFALTRAPAFFERLGFRRVEVMTLPRKVWSECFRCPKFPGCDEVAVVRSLGEPGIVGEGLAPPLHP